MDDENSKLDEQMFRKLFDLHFDHLRNFMYYKTSDAQLSEDVAQDAFIKLWETRSKVRMATVKTYLFTIANNLAINKLKRNQLKYNFLAQTELKQDSQDPQYILEEQEFKTQLESIIASIPDGSREVFLMNRIDGLKYGEIAEMLEISVKAVEKRMSKALAILRDKLDYKV
jgi:RNA polymerase sigma-70 factor (ECF subfamily)